MTNRHPPTTKSYDYGWGIPVSHQVGFPLQPSLDCGCPHSSLGDSVVPQARHPRQRCRPYGLPGHPNSPPVLYHDPDHTGYSVLKVINDDIVMPGAGFETHGHQNMEIISYVLSGAIEHQDSEGNRLALPAGEFQLMSAGTGIYHSTPDGRDGSLKIRQDVLMYRLILSPGASLNRQTARGRKLYLHQVRGGLILPEAILCPGDGLKIERQYDLDVVNNTDQEAEVLLFDLP